MDFEDRYITCPVNKEHKILQSRIMFHLTKCTKKPHKYAVCTFNSNHVVKREDLRRHMKTECPDRLIFERKLFSPRKANAELVSVNEHKVPQSTECWDDFEGITYNPKLKLDAEPILQNIQAVPKQNRKDFRYRERLRFSILGNSEITASPQSDAFQQQLKPETLNKTLKSKLEAGEKNNLYMHRPPLNFSVNRGKMAYPSEKTFYQRDLNRTTPFTNVKIVRI